jgi:hypothetical protein
MSDAHPLHPVNPLLRFVVGAGVSVKKTFDQWFIATTAGRATRNLADFIRHHGADMERPFEEKDIPRIRRAVLQGADLSAHCNPPQMLSDTLSLHMGAILFSRGWTKTGLVRLNSREEVFLAPLVFKDLPPSMARTFTTRVFLALVQSHTEASMTDAVDVYDVLLQAGARPLPALLRHVREKDAMAYQSEKQLVRHVLQIMRPESPLFEDLSGVSEEDLVFLNQWMDANPRLFVYASVGDIFTDEGPALVKTRIAAELRTRFEATMPEAIVPETQTRENSASLARKNRL